VSKVGFLVPPNRFDDRGLRSGLGLDDGLDAVLGLVDHGLDVVLVLDLDRAFVDDLLLDEGLVLDDPLGFVDDLVTERQILHSADWRNDHRGDGDGGRVDHWRTRGHGKGACRAKTGAGGKRGFHSTVVTLFEKLVLVLHLLLLLLSQFLLLLPQLLVHVLRVLRGERRGGGKVRHYCNDDIR
jgi:hypothetical protein